MTAHAPARPLATSKEVAEYLGITTNALAKLRMEDGAGPQFIRTGAKTIRYRWEDVHAWVDAHTHTSTDDYAA